MYDLLARADNAELALCLRLHGLSRRRMINRFFASVSRLGDGVFWYGLMAGAAVVGGPDAVMAMLHTGLTALVGVVIYVFLKNRLVRPRPYISHGDIVCRVAPLDQYSFPSGHTLHAVLFTTMFLHYVPVIGWIVLPFAALVALSRVVLGLHYPSDVAVGAALGVLLASMSLTLLPISPTVLPDSISGWLHVWRCNVTTCP